MQNNNTFSKTENKVLFSLGQIFLTIGAREALEVASQFHNEFLANIRKVIGNSRKGNWRGMFKF